MGYPLEPPEGTATFRTMSHPKYTVHTYYLAFHTFTGGPHSYVQEGIASHPLLLQFPTQIIEALTYGHPCEIKVWGAVSQRLFLSPPVSMRSACCSGMPSPNLEKCVRGTGSAPVFNPPLTLRK